MPSLLFLPNLSIQYVYRKKKTKLQNRHFQTKYTLLHNTKYKTYRNEEEEKNRSRFSRSPTNFRFQKENSNNKFTPQKKLISFFFGKKKVVNGEKHYKNENFSSKKNKLQQFRILLNISNENV